MEHLLHIRGILARWAEQHDTAPVAPDAGEEAARSTRPDAPMQLVLRFMTETGPRTIIASGIPLQVASEITAEMMRAGHFAQYVDERPRLKRPISAMGRKSRQSATSRSSLKLAVRH